jgi:hypothetical protein
MLRNNCRSLLLGLACFLATLPLASHAHIGFAVTSTNALYRFDLANNPTAFKSVAIAGLAAGDQIVGLDFRPATNELFGLGLQSRVYAINPVTGVATQVGAAGAFTLTGTSFGFDFNPTVDRIRVVSDLDQNLRLNPATGGLAATDTPLAYALGDPNAGQNPNVVGSAYVNNVSGAATTTLYGIDTNLDVLVLQNPPNSGTLNTVGPLGVNAQAIAGFDIVTEGSINTAYALLQVGAAFGVYQVNLVTGAATSIFAFDALGPTFTAFATARNPVLANISTRGHVLTGDSVMIGGFVILGQAPQTVAVVATGPSLAAFGITNPLANPSLTLVRSSDQAIMATNDDWQAASNAAALQAAGFAPSHPQEAAVLVTLQPGAYTAIVQGVGGSTGISVIGVYVVPGP